MTSQPESTAEQVLDQAAARDICVRIFDAFAHGQLGDIEAVVHPDGVNREASTQPPENRVHGPNGFYATALWLRSALADMSWDINEVAVTGDLIAVHTTGRARQVGTFTFYKPDGSVDQAFPPTGETCTHTQTHWLRIADGKLIEHWANRDDLGMARQLGWIPPSPPYLLRMALATRRARRRRPSPS